MRATRIAHVLSVPKSLTAAMLLVSGLTVGAAAFSPPASAQQRRPSEFQAPREMSEEEIRRAKERSKLDPNLHAYSKGVTDQVTPVPWMAITLMAIVFLIAAPFAIRYYRDTSREIRDRTGPARPPRKAAARPADEG